MTEPVRGRREIAWPRWSILVALVVLSLGASYGAYTLAGYSWDQVVSYRSPYTAMSGVDYVGARPSLDVAVPNAEARRVVLVVIDGLRDDASRSMESITAVREQGADVSLTVPQPSLSYPTWTTILTGAPQQISGVTTNWYEGRVPVETLFDVAAGSGRSVAVAGPDDLDTLYGVSEVASATALTEWDNATYMSGDIVDGALALNAGTPADFTFVLLPDVDVAGHAFGGASDEYAATVARVDEDLTRLIEGLDDGYTTFIVLPDHGHIDSGGHGGGEVTVTTTFAAFAGPGVAQTTASANLEDIAPTVAVIAGLQAPLHGTGTAIDAILAGNNGSSRDADMVRATGITLEYISIVLGSDGLADLQPIDSPAAFARLRANADAKRLAAERSDQLPWLIAAIAALAAMLVVVGIRSWRALVASVSGAAVYFGLYNALFFLAHTYSWSLSTFNEESQVSAFFNERMLEAAGCGAVACVVAALVYMALRREPQGPHSGYLPEWLALGPTTILLTQLVLALQAAVFVWQWGASVVWILPDMQAAFKYDLDLIQLAALAASALLGAGITWAIGRLHPRTRKAASR